MPVKSPSIACISPGARESPSAGRAVRAAPESAGRATTAGRTDRATTAESADTESAHTEPAGRADAGRTDRAADAESTDRAAGAERAGGATDVGRAQAAVVPCAGWTRAPPGTAAHDASTTPKSPLRPLRLITIPPETERLDSGGRGHRPTRGSFTPI
ncbi:hypothetical protein GCM10023195_52620 [Actinoallomurus liliacearum]|uniref:Uncharacterized protein n=1 Tax=Actinoallomurus liliacearum TaxID=1080073 RepID=A0ABP8TNE3_9ACTN